MLKTKLAKIAGIAVGATVAFGAFAPMASAVTVAELQAQINALMAQLASLSGGSVSTGTAITSDLTVGSSGAQVSALQSALVAQGHLVMPAGTAMGYFGSLTKAAVMKWQAASGVPATGYFGPLSRAKFNASAGATGTVPGATVGSGSTSGGSITTPGVEGTITVSLNPTPASSKLYEGSSKVAVMGIKLEAKTSDIKIERVKLDLDHVTGTSVNDVNFYNKIGSKIYLMDGSNVLASSDLNSSTVVKDGTDYFVTLSGFGYVVPKDSIRVLTVALDAKTSWDSDFNGETFSVTVPAEGVRGIDGAGVNQYGPSTGNGFSRNFTTEGELSSSATLALSTASDTPLATEVIASQGSSENELDGLEVLKFSLRAEKDNVTVTDAIVSLTMGGTLTTATATTAYIYDGSTLVGSAALVRTTATAMTGTFLDIDYVVPVGATKTLTVKLDIDTAGTAATTFTASVAASTGITAERSDGTAVLESGSATGETVSVRSAGPQFSLVSKPTVSYTAAQGGVAAATSTAKATFVVHIKALGDAIEFGTQSASSTFGIATFKGGVKTVFVNASTTNFTIPSSGVTTSGILSTSAFQLAENQETNVTVEVIFPGRLSTGALLATDAYAFGVQEINWSTATLPRSNQVTNFMDNKTSWRTDSVTLP